MLHLREWIEWAAEGIEILAVLVMVSFILYGTVRWLLRSTSSHPHAYETYRTAIGKALLIGLELLVAADIIRTVALEPTMSNLTTLAVLVAVRTALGWSLSVEIEGRWPWQAHARHKDHGEPRA